MKRSKPTTTKSKRRKERASTTATAINPMLRPDAAGIDIGSAEFVVALPPGRCENWVRTFDSFTSGTNALRDWLVSNSIKTVAMESTGNYWIHLHDTLVAAGIDVFLVNARHVKGVPGRKTDVQDAQWLQQLHAAGLVKKSYRPDQEIVPIRFLMRHRSELVGDGAKQLHLMQKTLTELNLKIHHVFSDIDGMSAQAIIDAILAGERDPARLADLRDRRCRSPLAKILEALNGSYREEYLFVLKQSQQAYRAIQASIQACDAKLGELIAKVQSEVTSPLPPAPKEQHRINKNAVQIAGGIFAAGHRFYGVDLSTSPGVSAGLIATLMSEVGTREHLLGSFRSAEAFSSWLGLNPDNRITGGKILTAKTRSVQCRLATAFRLAAFGLQQSDTAMGHYLRKMKGRLGKAEGITATAHKLARVVFGMIESQKAYAEEVAFKPTAQATHRRIKTLTKQAATLGFTLTPAA
jgi:transposase